MRITADKKLIDIQKAFTEKFPFLKIEFYAHRHQPGEGSPLKEMLDHELTIGEVRSRQTEGDLAIDGQMEVRVLEKRFFEDYGLNAQVFRRSGELWMQTSATDQWTLEKQNRKGAHSDAIVKNKS